MPKIPRPCGRCKLLEGVVRAGHVRHLGRSSLRVLMVLHSFMHHRRLEAWPSAATIGDLAGLSQAATYRALDDLWERALIRQQREVRQDRRGRRYFVTVYRFPPEVPYSDGFSAVRNGPADSFSIVGTGNLSTKQVPEELAHLRPRGAHGTGTATAGTGEQKPATARDITLEDVERILGSLEVVYDGPAPCPVCAARGAGRVAVSGPDAHDGGRA